MDTAAAAAAAVVVDLSAEPVSKSSASTLISKPKIKPAPSYVPAVVVANATTAPCNVSCEHDIANCLGSTVESMSASPPTTPARIRGIGHEVGLADGSGEPYATHGMVMNGLKDLAGGEVGHGENLAAALASLNTTSLTSSTNASTTPMSALLTAPSTATTTAPPTATTAGTIIATATAAAATTTTASGGISSATTTATTTTLATGSSNGNGNSNSNSSSSSSSKTTMASANMDQLLHWQDMPKYLQFNPYVLKGYRPLQTFKGCLLSLFYWHNETINILTHAIPIFYILAIVPGLMPWDSGYKFLSFCHVFGSVAPWCGSFVYHLFMNIEKGENFYYTLLKLDMVGIWVSQSFGALPLVTATTLCFTPILKWFIITAYCLLSLWGLYKALTASSPWQRRLCFALPFAMRSVLTFLRIRGMVGGSHMALSHVYLQVEVDGVSILGGAIGAMRIPEKWFPGLVDFYLNSHNIMHVLVVVAVYSMHKATIKDFEWMSTQTCNTVANATVEQSLTHIDL
ncbi:progestin and adipoQ receptor family member 4 isoform X1 [Drosophila navojoa]|uniref:progestin and adipoQ receptor family member 4 isoform X1 n=1 Tax=Drosophila navojoa TaxID=7232 RepID=UPI0011BE8EAC|nr:progestin and adipoQ receptor family member 4 isoform X1 [Drosophila navojoa]